MLCRDRGTGFLYFYYRDLSCTTFFDAVLKNKIFLELVNPFSKSLFTYLPFAVTAISRQSPQFVNAIGYSEGSSQYRFIVGHCVINDHANYSDNSHL